MPQTISHEEVTADVLANLQASYPAATVSLTLDPLSGVNVIAFDDGTVHMKVELLPFPKALPSTWRIYCRTASPGYAWGGMVYPFNWSRVIEKLDSIIVRTRALTQADQRHEARLQELTEELTTLTDQFKRRHASNHLSMHLLSTGEPRYHITGYFTSWEALQQHMASLPERAKRTLVLYARVTVDGAHREDVDTWLTPSP